MLEEQKGLNVAHRSKGDPLSSGTDIYLVDTYGETLKFLNISKIAFLGGSLVDYKGHNPMEAARLGIKILHGKHISNHKEAYKLLKRINISKKINNIREALFFIKTNIYKNKKSKKIKKQLNKIGKTILLSNFKETCRYI